MKSSAKTTPSPPPPSGRVDLILGTAGHIDHGKSTLVKLLSGVDPDRLPEERDRGITIDLGFANVSMGDYQLGIVDVPGHERFVRNMLAGATGMDLAMLVVAADDSVKTQTREHLDVLRLLDLPAGVIVLTKCDLADPDWIDLVEEEVRDLVSGTFLEQAPIVRVAAPTGEGVEQLRDALAAAATVAVEARQADDQRRPFRLAIDRVFSAAGHGTVVTGSVTGGTARLGDELVLQPGGVPVRVRGLQTHNEQVEEVHRGQRAAMNLAGVHHQDVLRGMELAGKGQLLPHRLLTVELSVLESSPIAIKHRLRCRLHIGTMETMATVLHFSTNEPLVPGASGYAQILAAEPVVSVWGQPFVLRRQSPVETIAGGRVLNPEASRIRKPDDHLLAQLSRLSSAQATQRADAALFFRGVQPWSGDDLFRLAGVTAADDVLRELVSAHSLAPIKLNATKEVLIHHDVLAEVCRHVEAELGRLHDLDTLQVDFEISQLRSRLSRFAAPGLIDAVLNHLHEHRRVRLSPGRVGLAGRGSELSDNEAALLTELIEGIRSGGLQPPTTAELSRRTERNRAIVPKLLDLAVARGDLVRISSEILLHKESESHVRETLAVNAPSGGWTVSQIREALATSRKFAIPICEYLDRVGFTKRRGDVRLVNG